MFLHQNFDIGHTWYDFKFRLCQQLFTNKENSMKTSWRNIFGTRNAVKSFRPILEALINI